MKPRTVSLACLLGSVAMFVVFVTSVSFVASAASGSPSTENENAGQKAEKEKDKEKEKEKDKEKEKEKEKEKKGDGKARRPIVVENRPPRPVIPEIPRDRLPKRTRVPPDPTKTQYIREPVYVAVEERVRPMKGEEYKPKVRVVEQYLAEYFRRAGHEIAASPGKASFRVEGEVLADFWDVLTFREQIIAWKYSATATLRVLDDEGRRLETIEIPEVFRENVKDEKTCVVELRRYVAKLLYDRIFNEGGVFTDHRMVNLLSALVVDPLEAEDPLTGKEVVERLADIGLPAVPYLLEALTDTRTVLAEAEYPNLENLDDLKVYHLADKALEEIFQKISRMNLKTKPHERFVMIRGWENEWRRFCTPFRESPVYRRRLERAAERRARKAERRAAAGKDRGEAPEGRRSDPD